MRKYAVLPVSITIFSFVILAVTGNVTNLRISAVSIAPLFCAAGIVLIAWDMKTLFLNAERSSRNDDIPELTDEEFRAHHKLFGNVLLWWAVPQILPLFWFGTVEKTIVSLTLFFAALIGTGIFCKQRFRPIIQNRRAAEQHELDLQRKRESGWR